MFKLFNRMPSISTDQLKKELNNKVTLLDVRTPNEYRQGHISGAKNYPLNKMGNYKNKADEKLYVICQSGMRSKRAAKVLQKKGYEAINVRGGMNQWNGTVRGGKL